MTIARGLIAGAAGTVALNALTYLDMTVRGRAASSVPADTVQHVADAVGADLASGNEQAGRHRAEGLGALLGYATGLGVGAIYGLVRDRSDEVSVPVAGVGLTLAAMAGANVPIVAAGVTDPRQWGVRGWLADAIPHLAYGLITAGVYGAVTPSGDRARA